MKSLREHSAELAQFFGSLADFGGYEGADDVAGWLSIVACIKNVDYDMDLFDPGGGVCELADIWAENQVTLQKKLVNEITRFLYCWASLEVAIDRFVPDEISLGGKIKNLCYFLKTQFDHHKLPDGYRDLVAYIKNRACNTTHDLTIFKKAETWPVHLSEPGFGIYSVYKLRNQLAHGAYSIPVKGSGLYLWSL